MSLNNPLIVHNDDIYSLTIRGHDQLQSSGTNLALADVELLVLIDGHATVAQIRRSVRSLSSDQVSPRIQQLTREGYIDLLSNQITNSLNFADFFNEKTKPPSAAALDQAQSVVAQGVTMLQEQGYYVRIALRSPERTATSPGNTPLVLIVEDDMGLAKFVKYLLESEGMNTRLAANREEIVNQLRCIPLPDLVLLDVMLPDTDGFNVLLKMREHPVFKNMPLLMLTAKATREAVLAGLAGGANGYITKPFNPEALIMAVKAVLGIPKNPFDRRYRAG